MTVASQTSSASYTGNAVTVAFPVPFEFLVNTDVSVQQKVAATGVISTLVLNSDYTLSGAGNPAGGTVTLAVAPAVGDTLYIARSLAIVQNTAYPSNSPFPASSHETALDRLTMISQQIAAYVAYSLNRNPLGNTYDLQGNTLVNSAPAVNPQDVPTLQQMQAAILAGAAAQLALPVGSSLVGFQQAGTGASARTMQDKARETVSVKDYGAVGDGVHDDTAAITAAFAYAATLARPCCVQFPFGTFLISAGFTVAPNVSVAGQGRGSTAIRVNANSVAVFSSIQATATDVDISISGLSIQSAKTGTVGVKFTLCNKTLVRDMEFAGCAQNMVLDRGKIHQIANIIVTGFGTNPFGTFRIWSSVDTDYIYNVNMHNVLGYNSATGMNTVTDPAFLYLRRGVACYFHHFRTDDMIDNTTGNPVFVTVENDCQGCKFSDMIGVYCYIGVLVQRGTGVAIDPNAIEFDSFDVDQPTLAAYSFNNCKYVTVNGGMITARGGFQGINPVVFGSGASYVIFQGVTIAGFNSGTAGTGIFFNGATYVTVANCIIDQAFNAFVFSAGNHQRIYNCILTNCTNKYSGSYNTAGNLYANNDGFNPLTVVGPSLPSTGTIVTNNLGVACSVNVIGGTVSGINLNGSSTGLVSGSFLLYPGDTIQVFYTAAPSWTWIGH